MQDTRDSGFGFMTLFSGILDDARVLMRQEAQLLKDELLLEILYGDRIRKTIERLNYEWLKKMWKASDDDFRVFWFEQIRKKFEEYEDKNGYIWGKI